MTVVLYSVQRQGAALLSVRQALLPSAVLTEGATVSAQTAGRFSPRGHPSASCIIWHTLATATVALTRSALSGEINCKAALVNMY